jgi:hypothetical protein
VENHPHELWQKQKFGVYHTSNGRRLPVHHGALILPQHIQDERAEAVGREDHHVHNAPFEGVHNIIEGARAYNRNVGLGDPHDHSYADVRTNAHDLKTIGRAYQKLPDWDDKAVPAFHRMGDEVNQQYDHLTNRMGIKVHPVDYDPYKNVHEMVSDLRDNKRIKVLKTASTGSHPFFSDDDNDKFRAVHDAFGHAATGRGFDAHGEEAAFAAHSKMFSPHARPAMTSETRGQNAFLHLNGEFGDQKIGILPQHMHEMAHDLGQYRHTASANGHWNAGRWYAPDIHTYCPTYITTTTNGTTSANTTTYNPHYAADWDEFRRAQDAQQRRFEQPGIVGGQEEHDAYFGRGEHSGAGVERKLTSQDWIKHSRGQSFDDLPPEEQEWHHGHLLGEKHATDIDNADLSEMDSAHDSSPHPEHFYQGYVDGLHSTLGNNERIALRVGWSGAGHSKVARAIAQGMPRIVIMAHDSGDAEVVFHCPFCGSGQVLARNDGTIECQFCSACFTVQVQPQYPAFPQTINGMPVQVPGMGPQWPGQDPGDPAAGQPVDPNADQDGDGVPDDQEQPPGQAPPDEDDGGDDSDDGNPFAKKSLLYRTVSGAMLDEDRYVRHLALAHASDPQAVLTKIREENGF